jgi:pimeloyl-ACP methyl ester carboxylesterase
MLNRLLLTATANILGCTAIVSSHAPAACAAPAIAAPAPLIQRPHISVQAVGSGSPVILIPGLSSPRAVWDGVTPALAKSHTVYLVQVNGFGGDDPRANLQPGILDGAVAELHALIAERKLQGAAVVGHSMGGLLALMLAKAHPGDAGRLMIVDALPFIGTIFAPGATAVTIEPQAKAMAVQMQGLYGKPLPDAAAQAIAMRNSAKPASQALVAQWTRAADMRVSGQALYEDMTTDLRPDLPNITAPITLVYPWSPDRMPEASAGAFYHTNYKGAPSVRFVGIADSGHFAMLDQPEAFAAALTAFLQ